MTGSINDVTALTALAKTAGALVWIDAVQLLVPHHLPDVQAIGCDFLVCSSYKFFGPHLGVLWDVVTCCGRCRCTARALPERRHSGPLLHWHAADRVWPA